MGVGASYRENLGDTTVASGSLGGRNSQLGFAIQQGCQVGLWEPFPPGVSDNTTKRGPVGAGRKG